MSREQPADDTNDASPEVLEQWLEKAADSQGVSETEIINRMLSSYWIFQELSEMLSDSEGQNARSVIPKGRENLNPDAEEISEREEQSSSSADGNGAEGKSNQDIDENALLKIIAELESLPSPAESVSPQDSQETGRGPDERMARSTEMYLLRDELNELKKKTSELSIALDQQDSRNTAELEQSREGEIVSKLDAIKDTLDDLSRADSSQKDRPEAHTSERIEAFERELAELAETVESEIEQLEASQADLERWTDNELDGIEQVFDELFERTDQLEQHIDDKLESVDQRIDDIEEYVDGQTQLAELKREANDHGISTAVCEHCSERVDLGLLMDPNCPNCDRVISGINPASWIPFSSNTLETKPAQDSKIDALETLEKRSRPNTNTGALDEELGDSGG